MQKTIEKFLEAGMKELEGCFSQFFEHPNEHGKFVMNVKELVLQLGLDLITEAFEEMDELLKKSAKRRLHWNVVKTDRTMLLTTLGNISYEKTLYVNKDTGERTYLVDRLMEMDAYTRMTDDAAAQVLEEAVDNSYKKAGKNACVTQDFVSKKTVMNKIHSLEFPARKTEEGIEKKKVRYLYIDADEGHIPLQFMKEKGDISEGIRNIEEPKLIYVYEGIAADASGKRHRLINPYYFGGIYEGTWEIEQLWKEVYLYIDDTYDMNYIEKIYINSDAGRWIRTGIDYMAKSIHVLDGYHLDKSIREAVAYCGEEKDDMNTELRFAIKDDSKKAVKRLFKEIREKLDEEDEKWETKMRKIDNSENYILNNFDAARLRLVGGGGIVGSSTEPHISHLFAERMAMKPMGWSKVGVDKMSRLRIYKANKGNMLSLIRYQKNPKKKIEPIEILSRFDIEVMERELQAASKKGETYYEHVYPVSFRRDKIWRTGWKI